MPDVPDSLIAAMRAAGVDPDAVLAQVDERDPIPSDDAVVAEERGDWRSELPDPEPDDLSEAEQAMIQPTLLDAEASDAARDLAMQRVDAAADPEWRMRAAAALARVAARGEEFTADDVWVEIGESPYPVERRALGPLVRAAATAGLIENTGRRKNSERPEHHSYPCTIWRPRC